MMYRCLYIFLVVLGVAVSAHAQKADSVADKSGEEQYVLLPDSSNFVTVSILAATPGQEGYSSLGHCALRMECPVHNLDYCFTFESQGVTPWFNYLAFLTGNMPAGFHVIPTETYIQQFSNEGRGITQYSLQLSLHEEQELWRFLDTDWEQGVYRKFDFLRNNCTSVCYMAVETIMWQVDGEIIKVAQWPEPMTYDNGHGIMYLTRDSPWMQFFLMALVGIEAEDYWPQEERLSPELIGEVLTHASVIDDEGVVRPFVDGEPVVLLKQKFTPSCTFFTPTVLFLALLIIVVLVSIGQIFLHWTILPRWLDIFLLLIQTIAGFFFLYISFISNILGAHWNWLLLIFNPIPFILWLFFNKRKTYYRVFYFYSLVLLLIVAFGTVISSQFFLPNRLIATLLFVRCLAKSVKKVKTQIMGI